MRRQITLSEIVNAALQTLKGQLYHCMPGSVVAYHEADQSIDCQPVVNDVRFDIDTGERFSEQWPVIPHVPIAWPSFSGGKYALVGTMAAGDNVMLVSFDLDPTAWRTTGNRSDPADTRRHVGSYWWALPTDLTTPGVLPSANGGMVIGQPGAAPQIQFTSSNIILGNSGGDFVALASKVNDAIKAQGTWAAGGTGSGYVPPVTASQPVPDVGSTLIKAQ